MYIEIDIDTEMEMYKTHCLPLITHTMNTNNTKAIQCLAQTL